MAALSQLDKEKAETPPALPSPPVAPDDVNEPEFVHSTSGFGRAGYKHLHFSFYLAPIHRG